MILWRRNASILLEEADLERILKAQRDSKGWSVLFWNGYDVAMGIHDRSGKVRREADLYTGPWRGSGGVVRRAIE